MKAIIKVFQVILGLIFLLSALGQISHIIYGSNWPVHLLIGLGQSVIGFFFLKTGFTKKTDSKNINEQEFHFDNEKEKATEILIIGSQQFLEYWLSKGLEEKTLRRFLKIIEENSTYEALLLDAIWLNPMDITNDEKIDIIKNELMYLFMTWNEFPNSTEQAYVEMLVKELSKLGVEGYTKMPSEAI